MACRCLLQQRPRRLLLLPLLLLALLALLAGSWRLLRQELAPQPRSKRQQQQQHHHHHLLQHHQQQQQQREVPASKAVRILHQSWKTAQLPPLFSSLSATFSDCLPGYKRRLWTDSDNRQLVADSYAWFLARYDSLAPGVQRADVARLLYLHKFGGVYCDLDCECLNNFDFLLANTSLAFGAMRGSLLSSNSPSFVSEGHVENSFMYSRPGHPFLLDLIVRLNQSTPPLAIMESGPYLVMQGINRARKLGLDRTKFDNLPYLTVYPPQYFNPFSWIEFQRGPCRLYGKLDAASRQECRRLHGRSYVLQYHTQVWDKGRANVLQGSGDKRNLSASLASA